MTEAADDPPGRVQAWLATVNDAALRQLDLALLLDLLRIEAKPAPWRELSRVVAAEIERRTLVGGIADAQSLAEAVARESGAEGRADLRPAAEAVMEALAAGPIVRHLVLKLRKVEDRDVDAVNRLAHTLGPRVIRPLAEALAVEEHDKAIRRLRELLLGFGAAGRQSAEQLTHADPQVQAVAKSEPGTDHAAALGRLPHVRVGRLQVEARVEARVDARIGDMATFKQLYNDAVAVAGTLWDSARVEGMPDADAGRGTIDTLAQAVAQNRTALLALTALKSYDNYTFTHMVNVSILTMGQACGLGIEGPLLREFGLAALLHDIGKVRTPPEILNKPEKLTDREFDILRQHTVDGAEILRRTPEIPALAPVVAFEHHLRLDGTGYPAGVNRGALNLGTMLCGIADVYDAMRSQRVYQEAFPTDRILAVLQRNDGSQFDQNLVRRFSQLVGIYPVGNLVRLDTGEVAIVTRTYAPDPYRPGVRGIGGKDGVLIEKPYELSLWQAQDGQLRSIQTSLDPATFGIDPLTYL